MYGMYGRYGTVSATVRYSTVYGTVHRKWSGMYGYTFSPLQEGKKMIFLVCKKLFLKAKNMIKKIHFYSKYELDMRSTI